MTVLKKLKYLYDLPTAKYREISGICIALKHLNII